MTWTLSFGRWLGLSSFHLADPVSEQLYPSTITSQSALILYSCKFSRLNGTLANHTGGTGSSITASGRTIDYTSLFGPCIRPHNTGTCYISERSLTSGGFFQIQFLFLINCVLVYNLETTGFGFGLCAEFITNMYR